MTMLTHTRGPLERVAHSWRGRQNVAAAHLATIKRLFMRALMMLTAVCAVAAIMAVKIAIYLPSLIHH
jgi:hypothetical protein